MRIAIIACVLVASVTILIVVGVLQRGTPVLTLRELLAQGADLDPGATIKIQRGRIVKELVRDENSLRFLYGELENPAGAIVVESDQLAPDNFRPGVGATLTGTYDPDSRVFTASSVATNCPSKYDAKKDPALNRSLQYDGKGAASGGTPGYGPAQPAGSSSKPFPLPAGAAP